MLWREEKRLRKLREVTMKNRLVLGALIGALLLGLCQLGAVTGATYTGYLDIRYTTPTVPVTKATTNAPTQQPTPTEMVVATTTVPVTRMSTDTPTLSPTPPKDCKTHPRAVYIKAFIEDENIVYLSNERCLELSIGGIGKPVLGEALDEEIELKEYFVKFKAYKFVCPIVNRQSSCGIWIEKGRMNFSLPINKELGWNDDEGPKPGIYDHLIIFIMRTPTPFPTTTTP
jgi:hypothetical protein